MAREARFESFPVHDVIELLRERVEMRKRRRRRHAVLIRFRFVEEEVEVGSAIRALLRMFERARGYRGDGDARRQREPFLHAREADVELPCRSEERRVGKECRSRWSP